MPACIKLLITQNFVRMISMLLKLKPFQDAQPSSHQKPALQKKKTVAEEIYKDD